MSDDQVQETRALDSDGEPIDGTQLLNNGAQVEIALGDPVTVMGAPLSTLILKRPRGGDLRAADNGKGSVATSLALIARLANIPPASAHSLDVADLSRVGRVIAGFTVTSRGSGAS